VKESVLTRTYMDGKVQSEIVSRLTVYKKKDGEYVHYISGYRKIRREEGIPILEVFVRSARGISGTELMNQMEKRRKAMQRVIRISPDGMSVSCLYFDGVEALVEKGDVKIVRASDVRFNNETKKWQIWVKGPQNTETPVSRVFGTRGEAIDFELEYMQEMLAEAPETPESVMKENVL